ncbi:MAG: hypothetical protein QY306_06510 [Anaerolineales bacterium]|nr:MAG: hypothetical protein QY306_06510 [Anaerolineales bacterium]
MNAKLLKWIFIFLLAALLTARGSSTPAATEAPSRARRAGREWREKMGLENGWVSCRHSTASDDV